MKGRAGAEFKGMVKALHAAGLEVNSLDVVYNHRRGQPPRPDAVVQGVDAPPTTGSSPTTVASVA
jgi:pullulanase/glycogen debranching enzyme